MIAAQTLLTLALSLLIAAQQPNVTPELRLYATTVAVNAISIANAELGNTASSTPVFDPILIPQTSNTPTVAPVAALVIPQVVPLSIKRVDYGDPRWFNDEDACYRVALYLTAEKGSQIQMTFGTSTIATETVVDNGGIDGAVARFVYQPSTSTPQTLTFSSSNGATVEYQCR